LEDGGLSGELDGLSNEIEQDLKTDLDVAVAASDYNERTVLSALIDGGLDSGEGQTSVDENLKPLLEKWSSHYNGEDNGAEE
jgi:hypothetical protein